MLRRHAWRIVGLAVVVAVLAALVVFAMTPIYRASATLLIEPREQKVVSIEEVYAPGTANAEYYQTQFELLRSRQIAARVVDRLGLAARPGFVPEPQPSLWERTSGWAMERLGLRAQAGEAAQPALTDEQRRAAAIARVRGSLDVAPVRNSQLTYIHYEDPDPALAAQIANAVAQAYIEGALEARLEMTQQAASWLTERLSGLRAALEASEAALQKFRDENQLVSVGGDVLTGAATTLDQTTAQLVEARRERTRLATLYEQARRLREQPLEGLESTPAVLQNPLIQSLKQAEAERQARLSELSERYGRKHPTLVQARSELAEVRAQIAREVERVVDGIEQEYRAAATNVAQLEAESARRKGEVQAINRKQYELETLEREVATNRELYNMFLTRFKETDVSEDLRTVNARIVDAAQPPDAPARPRKGLIIALAGLLAGVAGVALAFLMERLNDTLKSTEDVEFKLALPVMGLVPYVRRGLRRERLARLLLDRPQSAFAESIRTVRTGLTLSALDTPRRTLLVTSAVDREGKTILATDLALALSQMERVLLLECDLRRPTVAGQAGLDPKGPGLTEVLAGSLPAQDAIRRFADTELDVLTAGRPPSNPLEVLSSRRFAELLKELAQHYDRVVVDAPPVQLVSDALVLAGLVDGVLFVIRADSTPTGACRGAIKRLREARAPLVGAVLNQVPVGRHGRYAGYYGDYYGLAGNYYAGR